MERNIVQNLCCCRCSAGEKYRGCDAELMRARHSTHDAQSAARVATQTADSLRAELSLVKQSHDRLDADLDQARQLLRERTESLMNHFDQSVAVEVGVLGFTVPVSGLFSRML